MLAKLWTSQASSPLLRSLQGDTSCQLCFDMLLLLRDRGAVLCCSARPEHSEASEWAHHCCHLLPRQARQRRPCSVARRPWLYHPAPCPHRSLCLAC